MTIINKSFDTGTVAELRCLGDSCHLSQNLQTCLLHRKLKVAIRRIVICFWTFSFYIVYRLITWRSDLYRKFRKGKFVENVFFLSL